jgi:acyl-CoA dehydrogenase
VADRSFLAWPFLEERHRELAVKLESWAAEQIAAMGRSHKGFDSVDTECRALVEALGKGGWLKHAAAEDGKLDVRTLCLIRETLARHSGLADFAFAMQGLGCGPITLFGTPAQRRDYVAAVRAGRRIAAFALTEPAAGSDVAALATTARTDAKGWVLNGEKTFISNGGIADFYVVFARTGEAGSRGISAFIVDADNPGLRVAERIEVMAPHPLARLAFKDCRVPKTALLGKEGEGFKVAMATLDVFRTTVGAAALGFARRALDEALARVTQRQLFGATMAELPLVQAQLAQMALDVDTSALLVYRSAWTRDHGAERVTREAAMAKYHATEAAQRVIDQAVQLFGGLGVTTGVPVEQLYREIRALRIYEGASEVQKLVIARQVLHAHRPA